jgi:hypothetical protein
LHSLQSSLPSLELGAARKRVFVVAVGYGSDILC